MLEMTEGPCRMRKKMVRNDMFYNHYPYVPETEQETNVAVSAQSSAFVTALPRCPSFLWVPLSGQLRWRRFCELCQADDGQIGAVEGRAAAGRRRREVV